MTNPKSGHLKTGDKVLIITGDQKGLRGTIISLNKKKKLAYLDSIPSRKKRLKSIKEEEPKAVTEKLIKKPINISNMMLWDEDANRCDKIGYTFRESKKVRFFKKSGNILKLNN